MFSGATKYDFALEQLAGNLKHMKAMLAANHAETGVYDKAFNPDYERYLGLDTQGDLAFFTVRLDGRLVGFALFFLDTEIQQKDVRSATQSLNYIDAKHRGVGLAFMKFCDDILKNKGVNSIWRQASVKYDVGKVYERMGYALVEKSYLRRL